LSQVFLGSTSLSCNPTFGEQVFNFKKSILLALMANLALWSQPNTGTVKPSYPITPDEVAGVTNLGAGVNTPQSEYTPFITADERFLFFQTNRLPSAGGDGDFDLWYSMNKGTEAEPRYEVSGNVGIPVNSGTLDGHPTLRKLPSGEYEMYFCSFASAGRPGPKLTNIYHTVWQGGKLSVPSPVEEINSDYHDRMPSISQDGKYLFFSSDRPGGHGGDDIWYSVLDAATGKWGAPVNAGKINTSNSEVTPALHSDGTTLYFSSKRDGGVGGYDIYFTQSVARLADPDAKDMLAEGWAEIMNLGKPFNSEFDDEYPTVTENGERVYFTSNRIGGIGSADVYWARVPLFARPVLHITWTGKTLSRGGSSPVAAKLRLTTGDKTVAEVATTVADDGRFKLNLVSNKIYNLKAESEGAKTVEETLDTGKAGRKSKIEKDLVFRGNLILPARFAFDVQFFSAAGKRLYPKARYRIIPQAETFSELKFRKRKPALITLNKPTFKSEDEAITEADGFVIEMEAKKKGYTDLSEKRAFETILKPFAEKIPGVVTLKYVMQGAGEKSSKKEPESIQKPSNGPNQLKYLGRVFFASDVSDKTRDNVDSLMRRVAKYWKGHNKPRVYIYGHSDSAGATPYNRRLSAARAQLIKKLLIQKGVWARKIVVKGVGEAQRRVRNDNSDAGRRKNRRAEIYVIAPVEDPAPPSEEK
jgi:peptidoglycan-associated lipoprotein